MLKTSNIDTLIIYYVFSLLEHIEQHTKAMIVCMPKFSKTVACSCFYFCPSNLFSTDNHIFNSYSNNTLYRVEINTKIREYGSTLYVGLARAVSPTNTNFRLTFLLTRLQEALYEDLAV